MPKLEKRGNRYGLIGAWTVRPTLTIEKLWSNNWKIKRLETIMFAQCLSEKWKNIELIFPCLSEKNEAKMNSSSYSWPIYDFPAK